MLLDVYTFNRLLGCFGRGFGFEGCLLGFLFGFELCEACLYGGEVVPVAVAVAGLALAFLLLDLGVDLGDFLLEACTATLEVLDDFVLFHCCDVFNRLIG